MEAKQGFMEAFFDDLATRIEFTRQLDVSGHRPEAMLLSCCYIDGLGNHLYHEEEGSHRNFVRAIREHGGEEFLARIHLRQLRESLERMRGRRPRGALDLLDRVIPEYPTELLTVEQLEEVLSEDSESALAEWLREELWRGTLASIVYTRLRVPSVHGLGAPGGIEFDDSSFNGEPVPHIDNALLSRVAMRVNAAARRVSVQSGKWFGHDF